MFMTDVESALVIIINGLRSILCRIECNECFTFTARLSCVESLIHLLQCKNAPGEGWMPERPGQTEKRRRPEGRRREGRVK